MKKAKRRIAYPGTVRTTGEYEKMSCDNCHEQALFRLRQGEQEFTLGLSVVLECLMFAVKQGELPTLPRSWCDDVDFVYHTDYAQDMEVCYPDA